MREALHRRFSRATEPQFLFAILAVVFLALIWGTTLGVLHLRQAEAERAAAVASHNELDTYEAQIVRALREINQTLNLVKLWPGRGAGQPVLPILKRERLLPPDLLFDVSIVDRNGHVVESTREPHADSIAQEDYFTAQRDADSFYVGKVPAGAAENTKLYFSRRLITADGGFDGVVVVAVDASYFVSSYDSEVLGSNGVIALVGADGEFRIRRTGDSLYAGDTTDYAALLRDSAGDSDKAGIVRNSWDGESRWTGARELYRFPLAILVGLSVKEQIVAARLQTRSYIWWALAASVLVLVLATVLGRLSFRLAQVRQRELETRVAHAQQVEYLAYHDGLTGLPNRSLFSRLLSQRISEAQRYRHRIAVAFLDLDRFKQINDTLGHEAGDQLLKEVAARLRGCVRESDTVARLGGDEFVVLLPELPDEQHAAHVAQKILAATARPFNLLGHEFRVTASIGISTFPEDGLDEETLKKNADIAMYHAKAEGKNNFQFYSEKLNSDSLERMALESSLRNALERREFRLEYQAKRSTANGEITGVEALLRWQHPDLGLLPPQGFLPVAEETGLIIPIGNWVLRTVCEQCAAWKRQGVAPIRVSVNFTARQFRDERLLVELKAILADTGMDPTLLEIELHEGVLIQDTAHTLRTLTQLKLTGVRVAVDDFGVGYTSLATLQQFPLDTIKIDRSFTRDFVCGEERAGVADAVVAMGRSLSLTVVAQGVETEEQATALQKHACDEVQGFYYKRPLPADEITRLLQEQAAETA